ncbi:carboxypeptidase regulatory-like domain-containing protein [Candidatus Microgenomates bacterium]|nr:carboxypeptidase regulatory-like domain-containing protein [Candidatus Microgenomates bacterium]
MSGKKHPIWGILGGSLSCVKRKFHPPMVKKAGIFLLTGMMVSSLFPPILPAKAYEEPIPMVTVNTDSVFTIEKGKAKIISFTVSNTGGSASPYFLDVSYTAGLAVESSYKNSDGGQWFYYKESSLLYHSGSDEQNLLSTEKLYSYEGSGDPLTSYSRSYSLTFRATQTGNQIIKYRVAMHAKDKWPRSNYNPDTYKRYPATGSTVSTDQQGWNVKLINIKVEDTTPPPPISLLANAGSDQKIAKTISAIFDGTKSQYDSRYPITEYTWTENGVSLTSGNYKLYFFATVGTHIVTLTVKDTLGRTSSDQVTIETYDNPPPPPDTTVTPQPITGGANSLTNIYFGYATGDKSTLKEVTVTSRGSIGLNITVEKKQENSVTIKYYAGDQFYLKPFGSADKGNTYALANFGFNIEDKTKYKAGSCYNIPIYAEMQPWSGTEWEDWNQNLVTSRSNSITLNFCLDPSIDPVPINQPPIADFTFSPSSPDENTPILLNATTSHDAEGPIIDYYWQDNGNRIGSGGFLSIDKLSAGSHTITLTVKDTAGLASSKSATIVVKQKVINYFFDILDIKDLLTNKSIDGHPVYATADNLPIDQTFPQNIHEIGYIPYRHGKNGAVRIQVINAGDSKDTAIISSNGDSSIYFGFPEAVCKSPFRYLGISECSFWDGDYKQGQLEFELEKGEVREIDMFYKVPPDASSKKEVTFSVMSKNDPLSTKINSRVTFEVIGMDNYAAKEILPTFDYWGLDVTLLSSSKASDEEKAAEIIISLGLPLIGGIVGKASLRPVIKEGIKILPKSIKLTTFSRMVKEGEKWANDILPHIDEVDKELSGTIKTLVEIKKEALDHLDEALLHFQKINKATAESIDTIVRKEIYKGKELEDFASIIAKNKDIPGISSVIDNIAKDVANKASYLFQLKRFDALTAGTKELEQPFSYIWKKTGQPKKGSIDILQTIKNGGKNEYRLHEIYYGNQPIESVDGLKKALEESGKIEQIKKYGELLRLDEADKTLAGMEKWKGITKDNAEIIFQPRWANNADKAPFARKMQDMLGEGYAVSSDKIDNVEILKIKVFSPSQLTLNHSPGTYPQPVTATFKNSAGTAIDIYYTTNGGTPTKQSAKYDPAKPIAVNKTMAIKYLTIDRTTQEVSPVQTADYIIASKNSISGFVIDGESKKPLKGATVKTLKTATLTATTDDAGFYTIANLPTGVYHVQVDLNGYLYGLVSNIVMADGRTRLQDFTLTPVRKLTITGFVKDRYGKALANVVISNDKERAITNVSGYYSLPTETGAGRLMATKNGYYFNSISYNAITDQRINFTALPTYLAYGYVKKGGTPIQGVAVKFNGPLNISAYTNRNGYYQITLPAGLWQVGVSKMDARFSPASTTLDLKKNSMLNFTGL